jgi:hypothetical protein
MSVPLIEQNLHFLRQGAALLRRLDDGQYAGSADDGSAGVGPHFRHCLDFYLSLLRDLDGGRIDYDRRERESRIETDRGAALTTVERIRREVAGIDSERLAARLEVRADLAPGEDPATAWSGSSLGRELRFLASHTVHHFAIIATHLRRRGVELDESFGVAPATLAHRREHQECAR